MLNLYQERNVPTPPFHPDDPALGARRPGLSLRRLIATRVPWVALSIWGAIFSFALINLFAR